MSSIFGFTGSGFNLESMQEKLMHWTPDRHALKYGADFSAGVLELYKTPECIITPQPFCDEELIVCFDGRIDNRKELSDLLDIEPLENYSDIDFVIKAFRRWGEKCVDHLIGAFVFAVWNTQKNSLFIARDHLGIKPLFYAVIDDKLVFSSEMKGILSLKEFDRKCNERYLVAQFSALQLEPNETLYEEIQELRAGHFLTFTKNKLLVKEYWYLGMNKPEIPESVAEQVKQYGELFNQSVKNRLRTAGNLGAEVSGGLDSTGIAAFAIKNLGTGHPFYSYCYGKADKPIGDFGEKDDSDLVIEFCKNYKILDYLTIVNELDLSGEKYLKFYDEILDHIESNGVPLLSTFFLPKAQNQNVNVMLSGWAGDQMVTSTVGGFYEAKANKRMFSSLWKELRTRYNRRKSLIRVIYYTLKALFKPFYKVNLKKARSKLDECLLNPKLIEKYKLHDLPNFRYYLKSCTNIQEYQKLNILHRGINNRTVNHGLVGKHFNIDYRFPMLDVRLLEYIHQLPFSTTAPKGQTRFLFKKLIKGKVPAGVLDLHKSKVPTTPFGRVFFNHAEQCFSEELKKVDLKSLPFVREDYSEDAHRNQVELLHLASKLKE